MRDIKSYLEGTPTSRNMVVAFGLIIIGFVAVGVHNFLLFHSLAELLGMVVSGAIFFLAWNARHTNRSCFFLLLGAAYLGVGIIDSLHLLSYKGMGVFADGGANLPTQLWIAARYLEASALAVAPLLVLRKSRPGLLMSGMVSLVALLLASIFWWDIFPDCFIEPAGLTAFKVNSEYLICALMALAMVNLHRNRAHFEPRNLKLLQIAVGLRIVAELAFTFYVSVYGLSNLTGHLVKLLSVLFMYEAMVATTIRDPMETLYRELSQRNNELSEFVNVISHDLRSPLVSLMGFTKLLRRKLDSAEHDKLESYLDAMESSGQWMEEMLHSLLMLSKAGRSIGELERVPMREVVSDVLTSLRATLNEKDAKVRIDVDLRDARGDRLRIRQILQNLIGNCLVHCPEGERPEIRISSKELLGLVEYSVTDNGEGVEPDQIDRLFEIFHKGSSDSTGTGIGLSIVKKVVEAHGGTVTLSSPGKGQGCTVRFTLPAIGKFARAVVVEGA